MPKQRLKTTSKVPSSRVKLARLIKEHYQGRSDVRLVCDPQGSPRTVKSDHAITAAEIAKRHLTHQQGLGVFLVRPDNTCSFAAVDFDNKPDRPDSAIKSKVRAVAKQLDEVGIAYLICTSQSGRGYHLTVYFAKPIAARIARRFLLGVCQLTGLAGLEVFPKQEQLKPGKVGNALRLPLFNKSQFVDPVNLQQAIDPIQALEKIVTHTKHDVRAAAGVLGIDLTNDPTARRRTTAATSQGLSSYVQHLIEQSDSLLSKRWRGETAGLADESQSALVFSIACLLIRSYVDTDELASTLRNWCEQNDYKKGQREDWLDLTIDKAYERVQASHLEHHQARHDAMHELAQDSHPAIAARIIQAAKAKR